MRNTIFNSVKTLALILAWALWVAPTLVMADESAHPKEGSKSKEYSHGSPHGGGSSYAAKEGSKSKHGSPYGGKSYRSHRGGSHSKKYGGGHGRHGHRTDPFTHVLRFGHRMGLTEAQRTEIKNKQFEYKKGQIQRHADHKIIHLEMDRMVHSGELDESGLRALADKMSGLKSKSIHAMMEAKIALLRILTAEQRKKVSQLHSGH